MCGRKVRWFSALDSIKEQNDENGLLIFYNTNVNEIGFILLMDMTYFKEPWIRMSSWPNCCSFCRNRLTGILQRCQVITLFRLITIQTVFPKIKRCLGVLLNINMILHSEIFIFEQRFECIKRCIYYLLDLFSSRRIMSAISSWSKSRW